MKEYRYEIEDPMGLHARPASMIFMEAGKYSCSIEACWELQKADCKSLLAIMGLGARKGDVIVFRFEGEDEEAAYYAIRSVLDKK
ncbi:MULTISPECIES: HPr family phosphocarrier protein [Lacrimispora]|uniref:HPr family phosphocarrier protein n=1 Tax=Lacrimispora TaxID=2719231 RepID=UPI000BE31287|nr:HPr family phosphocarrier protein [Lacrimispora amygdalina]MDK2964417.1 phosphocarrier protein HPr [Lacrimispora sp.]